MVNPGVRTLVCGIALCCAANVTADQEESELPDMEFLEYLGMWEESDEDWQLLDEDTVLQNDDERSDPVPEGEESPENDDEG